MNFPIVLEEPSIPFGSKVLVTGANGLLGSHVADQFLAAGYNVRGTVRSKQKNAWMLSFFEDRYKSENVNFELHEVQDMTAEGCFDEAVRDCSGVVHTTSSITLQESDPYSAITKNNKTILNCMRSAAAVVSVRRFVITSSAWTISAPRPDTDFVVNPRNWNDEVIEDAYAVGTSASNSMSIFMAGKTIAEKECWKFMAEYKPAFIFNAVLPDTIFGKVLSPNNQGIPSTAGLIHMLFEGRGTDILRFIQPQYHCDCADVGRLHVAALLHPEASNERFVGHADRWNWNDILAMFRKWYPDRVFPEDMDLGRDISTVEDARSLQLLREVYGQQGWTILEDSVRANVQSFLREVENVRVENAMFNTRQG